MNRWLKTLGCFLVLLFGQSQAGLPVYEINKAVRLAALEADSYTKCNTRSRKGGDLEY